MLKQVVTLYYLWDGPDYIWPDDRRLDIKNAMLDSLSRHPVNETLKKYIEYTFKQLNGLTIGEEVKDFSYLNLDDNEVSLAEFNGKWVLLDFWFVGCGPCHEAIPDLKKLQSKFKDCLEIVSVNPIDNTDRVLTYKEKNDLTWNFYSAKHDSNIKSYFNIKGYPTFFLVDPNGNFRFISEEIEFRKMTNELQTIIKSDCE